MADEAGQKAMLYFIEVLMNSDEPIVMKNLAAKFGSKSFTAEMRSAAGGDETGLRSFLSKYPSLFHIEGNLVSINNHGCQIPSISEEDISENQLPNVSPVELELKAVKFFQDKLIKKGGKLPLRSLAGHLSQAPMDMRSVVGPQSEFKAFVIKHKDIFIMDAEEENVTLSDDILENCKGSLERSESDSSLESSANTTASAKSLSRDSKSKPSPITMTASEYKTMKFLKDLVEKNDGHVATQSVLEIQGMPEQVKNIVGDSDKKLTDFVLKFPNIFCLIDSEIALKKTKLNVIMAGSRPANSGSDTTISPPSKQEPESPNNSMNSSMSESHDRSLSTANTSLSSNGSPFTQRTQSSGYRTLSNHCGPVYHLAKLWGIVDLGRHEHVFFDRSILPDGYDDLGRRFKMGETLRFNAVRAARGSRARWRATHVWRDGEDIRSMYGTDATFSVSNYNTESVDDEIKSLLPNIDANAGAGDPYAYVDATQSSTGCIPVWTVNTYPGAGDDKGIPSLSMVPESKYMQKSVKKDGKQMIPGYMLVPTGDGVQQNSRKPNPLTNGINSYPATKEIACQTISTGDIMATQLYQDED